MSAAAGAGGLRVRRLSRGALDRLRDASGQTMVEFAIVLPLLVVLTLAIVQFGIVFKDWLTVTDTARIAARAAAVSRFKGQSPCTAAQAVVTNAAGGLALAACSRSGSDVTVTVSHPWSVSLPLLPFSQSGTLESDVTEALE